MTALIGLTCMVTAIGYLCLLRLAHWWAWRQHRRDIERQIRWSSFRYE